MQGIAPHGWAMARRGDIRVRDVLGSTACKTSCCRGVRPRRWRGRKFLKGMPEPRGGSGPCGSLGGDVEDLGLFGCVLLSGFRLQFSSVRRSGIFCLVLLFSRHRKLLGAQDCR